MSANLLTTLILISSMSLIVVESSLTYYWPVTSSNPFQASVGSKNLVSSNPTYAKDRFGVDNSAFRVTDVTNYVSVPSSYLLSSSFTISIWAINYNNKASWARVFDFSFDSSRYINWAFSNGNSGKPRFAINSPNYYYYDSTSVVPNIVWTHYVVAATSTSVNLYINSILVNSFSVNCVFTTYGPNNYFGKSYSSSDSIAYADFDEIKIYNHRFTQSEVTNEYQNATSIFMSQVDTSFYNYLAHYWPINGTTVDVVAGADLDSYNPTISTDRFGNANNAFRVSNSTNFFWAPNSYYFNTSNGFSVTLWFIPFSFSQWARLFDFGNGEAIDNFYTCVTNYIRIFTSSPAFNFDTDYDLTVSTWYHFGITYKNGNTVIYINGVLVGSNTGGASMENKRRWINYFGKSNWPNDPVGDVSLDEIKFFDAELTQQQVIYDYLATVVPYTSKNIAKPVSPISNPSFYQNMIHYWPINNQDYKDYVSGFDLKPTSSPGYVQDRFGNENSAYSATSSSYFDAQPGVYFNIEFTFTCWVNLFDTSISDLHLIDFGCGDLNSNVVIHLMTALDFYLFSFSGSQIGHSTGPTVQGTKWHHIALSVSSSTARLYFNGLQVTSASLSSSNPKILRTENFIGSGGNGPLTGYVDDIKIFNVSLSADEIYYDYNQKTAEFIQSVDAGFYDYLTHYWPIDQTAGLMDVITGVNLTGVNTQYLNDRNGNGSSAIRVTGSGSYLRAEPGDYFTSEFTITVWMYAVDYSAGQSWPRILDFGNGQSQENIAISYSMLSKQGVPSFGMVNPVIYKEASYPITTGKWYHFALSVNSTTAALYINGISISTGTLSSPVTPISRSSNYFGKSNYATDSPSNAVFDEIKFFGKALTHQQVIYDYLRNSTPYTMPPSLGDSFSFDNLTTDQVFLLLQKGYDITDCSGNCSNHGGCFIKQKVLYCSCDANYTGSTCSTNLDPCFYSPCLNNGTCVSNMTGVVNTTLVNYTCECSYPFSGSNCEIKADVCINTTCSHNGACVSNSTNQPECKCFYLFSGTNCETMSNKKKTITTVVAISSILAIIIIVTFYTIIVLMDLDTLFRKQRARRFKLNAPKRKTVRFQYIA